MSSNRDDLKEGSSRGQEEKNEGGNRRGVTSEFNLSPPPHLHNILNFPPNAHLPGSTPAPPRTHSRDMPVLVTPELGKSFDSSGVSPSPAATPCRPPRIPPPPSKKKPQINNWTPIEPQCRTKSKPSPALDTQLLEQMKDLKVEHSKAMTAKDLEIHYLRCGATDSKIATVNALLSVPPGKSVKGWSVSKDLPLLKNMSLADVEWEIRVRGYQHRLIYDPKNPPTKTNFATGASFYSRESYFKNILLELRDIAHGALIPSREYEGPPANSPLPVGATRNPAPNPPTYDVNHFLATGTRQKVDKPVSFTVKAGENNPSKKNLLKNPKGLIIR